ERHALPRADRPLGGRSGGPLLDLEINVLVAVGPREIVMLGQTAEPSRDRQVATAVDPARTRAREGRCGRRGAPRAGIHEGPIRARSERSGGIVPRSECEHRHGVTRSGIPRVLRLKVTSTRIAIDLDVVLKSLFLAVSLVEQEMHEAFTE